MTTASKISRALALCSLAMLQTVGLSPTRAQEQTDKSAAESASKPEKKAASSHDSDRAERATALTKVEQELAEVMDELVSARARAAVLARSLFHTELDVQVVRRADAQDLVRVVLRLDGVPVHDSDGAALASDTAELFRGYVTPGRHELAIELTEAGKDDASYGYTRSERYRIEIKKDRRTHVQLVLRDDSDMAEEAAEGDEGEYQLDSTVRVTSERARD